MIAGIVASKPRRSAPPSGLDGLLPNKVLGVLFYKGEKHQGEGGGGSDTEWTLNIQPGVQLPEESPFPAIMGQFLYDLGPFVVRAADGPIEMASGYFLHFLIQSGSFTQVIISDKPMLAVPLDLDADKKDAFNAWWDSKGQQKMQLLDAGGTVLHEFNMSAPTGDPPLPDMSDPTDPTQPRSGFSGEYVWGNSPYAVVTARLAPGFAVPTPTEQA